MSTHVLPATRSEWHRRIWLLTWPIILANITIPLVGVADIAVMGRLANPAYIGAVTVGTAIFSAIYWLFGFLRMSTTGLSAQAYGRGEPIIVASVFARAGTVALTLGLSLVILQVPLAALLFRIFDASPEVTSHTQIYYNIRILGAPALLLYMVELGVLFGLQRTKDTLWLSIGLNITNLTLDLILVLGFDMGVKGVAVGTVVSEWTAALLGLGFVWRGLRTIGWQHGLPKNTWDNRELRALFSIGSNLILRTFFVQLPFMTGTAIATRSGDVTLAAHGILMQLFFVMTFSLDGFAHTAETLAGFAYGAKNRQALRNTTVYCSWWALGLALATGAAFYFGGGFVIDAFTQAETVRSIAREYLIWLAIAPILCVWAFLFDGIFIGTTHIAEMRNAMVIAALGWAVMLWLTYDALGYHGVWLSMSFFMVARSLLLFMYYPVIEKSLPTGR